MNSNAAGGSKTSIQINPHLSYMMYPLSLLLQRPPQYFLMWAQPYPWQPMGIAPQRGSEASIGSSGELVLVDQPHRKLERQKYSESPARVGDRLVPIYKRVFISRHSIWQGNRTLEHISFHAISGTALIGFSTNRYSP